MKTFITVEFPPITLPIGTKTQGYWTKYPALIADKVSSLTVTPTFFLWGTPEDRDPLIFCEAHLYFDPKVWDTDRYGLVYTDGAFEEAAQAWLDTLHLSHTPALSSISYTEAGMQGDDYVGMEFASIESHRWTDAWGSHHAFLAWLAHAQASGWKVFLDGATAPLCAPTPIALPA